jgi:hypothetical protein
MSCPKKCRKFKGNLMFLFELEHAEPTLQDSAPSPRGRLLSLNGSFLSVKHSPRGSSRLRPHGTAPPAKSSSPIACGAPLGGHVLRGPTSSRRRDFQKTNKTTHPGRPAPPPPWPHHHRRPLHPPPAPPRHHHHHVTTLPSTNTTLRPLREKLPLVIGVDRLL